MLSAELIVKGKTAEQVYDQIVEKGLVSRLDHAAYLGSELAKAEIALRTGKEYIQDKPMFQRIIKKSDLDSQFFELIQPFCNLLTKVKVAKDCSLTFHKMHCVDELFVFAAS